jgi:6-methylsalicylate decarboxylase
MSAASKPHRIDTHHHIFPPRYLAKERERIVGVAPTYAKEMLEWTPQASLDVMDAGGIATAVTSISTPGVWFGDAKASRQLARDCNDYAAQIARDHKGRFGVFAALPLPDVDGSLREIEYAFDVLKADGIGLVTSYGDKWPGEPAFAPVFDELDRRRAVVYFHPTAPHCCTDLMPGVPPAALEFVFDTTRAIISLLYSGTFLRCANLRFIFSHAGGTLPMIAHRISNQTKRRKDYAEKFPSGVMHEFQKLYYDIVSAAHPVPFEAIRQIAGISHLLYGSDFPFWHPDVTAAGLAGLKLSADDLRAIERDNALALLPSLAI